MCLIIQKPARVKLDFEKFKTAVMNNPDGFGISVVEGDGYLYTFRDHRPQDPELLYKDIDDNFGDDQFLLHLRYTTAGQTILRNAHPFPVMERRTFGSDIRMAHNGTISKFKNNTWESDTRRFARSYVRPLFHRLGKSFTSKEILEDPFVSKLLDDQITPTSVLSFIDGFGNTLNVNAKGNGGFYDTDGVYYSNSYSFDPKHREPTSSYYYGGYPRNSNPVVTTAKPTTVADNHAKDTQVQKFTEKYELIGLNDLALLTDSAIKQIVVDHPDDAILLIKELLDICTKPSGAIN